MKKIKFEYIDLEKLNTEKEPYKYMEFYKKADIELQLYNGDVSSFSVQNIFSLISLASSTDHIYYYGWGLEKYKGEGRLFLFNAENISSEIFIAIFGKNLEEEKNE